VPRHRDHTDGVGCHLHSSTVELMCLAGWLAFTSGDHGLAQRSWGVRDRVAHTAGDRVGQAGAGSVGDQDDTQPYSHGPRPPRLGVPDEHAQLTFAGFARWVGIRNEPRRRGGADTQASRAGPPSNGHVCPGKTTRPTIGRTLMINSVSWGIITMGDQRHCNPSDFTRRMSWSSSLASQPFAESVQRVTGLLRGDRLIGDEPEDVVHGGDLDADAGVPRPGSWLGVRRWH
jgi:hypothetical protein